MKYKIDKEFFPFSHLAPPIQNAKIAGWMGSKMRPPRWIWKDKEISVQVKTFQSYDQEKVEVLVIEPRENTEELPCLVYYHGGGFFFGGAGYHYRLAKRYALDTGCKVVFVQYRLAPKYGHPTPSEDCYCAYLWVMGNTEKLGIDKTKVAVGGDSAGGALAAAVCQMARDRGQASPLFQLLIYPVTDRRMGTESHKKYVDTPMWNSKLSVKMWEGYLPTQKIANIAYASPMEASAFDGLPKAYIETAEFDCLHDEGENYAKALQEAGVEVAFHEIKGAMHGFDIVQKAPTTQKQIQARVEYIKNAFKE